MSEAARGEGGVLRNRLGERFMERYDPERMELSTRDRVALAAYTEIKEGRGTHHGGVWLDVSHLPRETILTCLPRVYETLIELQMLDVTTSPIEVAPTAHYSMGGIWVRPEDNNTGVEGLYAVGEAASGMHGANRLGGNSLIELLVYGRIVGEAAAAYSARLVAQQRSAAALAEARAEIDELLAADGPENVRTLQRAIRNTMTERAGVVRDEAGPARRARRTGRRRGTDRRDRCPPRHLQLPRPRPRLRLEGIRPGGAGNPRVRLGATRYTRVPQPIRPSVPRRVTARESRLVRAGPPGTRADPGCPRRDRRLMVEVSSDGKLVE